MAQAQAQTPVDRYCLVGNPVAPGFISGGSSSGSAVAACNVCELHAEAVFRVEGMDCNEEVVILERRLKPITGVEAISADLIGQRLHVKYDAAKLSANSVIRSESKLRLSRLRSFILSSSADRIPGLSLSCMVQTHLIASNHTRSSRASKCQICI